MHIINTVTEDTGNMDNISWCGIKVPFISFFVHKTIDDALRAAHKRNSSTELPCRECLMAAMSQIEREVHK